MGQVSTIGLDIAKRVFQAHGADSAGNEVFRKKLARGKVLTFLASQPSLRCRSGSLRGCPSLGSGDRQVGA